MKQKLIDNIDGMIAVLIFAKGIDPDSAYMMAEGKKVSMMDLARNMDFYQINNISTYELAKVLGLSKTSMSSSFARYRKRLNNE